MKTDRTALREKACDQQWRELLFVAEGWDRQVFLDGSFHKAMVQSTISACAENRQRSLICSMNF
jgi:hypothetical protein